MLDFEWALNTPPLKILSKTSFIEIVKIKSQYIQLKLVKIYIYTHRHTDTHTHRHAHTRNILKPFKINK